MTDMLFEKNEFNKAGKWISSTVTSSKETDLIKRLEELLSKDHSKPMLEIGIEQVLGKLEFIAKYYNIDWDQVTKEFYLNAGYTFKPPERLTCTNGNTKSFQLDLLHELT